MFDQQYEKSENFYRTIEIANTSDCVEYENKQAIDTYLYWANLVKENKSFLSFSLYRLIGTRVFGKLTIETEID